MKKSNLKWWFITIAVGIILSILPPPDGLTQAGQRSLALMVMAAILWLSEVLPIGASSLLIIAAAPLMGCVEAAKAFAGFSKGIIFLYIGGFIVAASMAKYGLDKRIALWTINKVGTSVKTIALGLMLGVGFLSMWLSSVVVALCLLPITLGIIKVLKVEPGEPYGKLFLFALAYSSLMGGIGTPIGTAPNALCMGFLKSMSSVDMSFVNWMIYGVPLAVVTLIVTWWLLVNVAFKTEDVRDPDLEAYVREEYAKLGSIAGKERMTLVVTVIFVILLVSVPFFRSFLGAKYWNDGTAAILGCLLLFMTGTLTWKDANKGIAWHLLLLFAAGFTLSQALMSSGAAKWLADLISQVVPASWIPIGFAVLGSVFTQMTSNTATAAILVPIAITTAEVVGINPVSVAIPLTLAVSLGTLTPIGSALNPIIYGQMPDGCTYVDKAGDYLKAGIFPYLACLTITIAYVVFILPMLHY